MRETITAGATGRPDRIDLSQYRHAIQGAPELIQHLAHLPHVTAVADGQPFARDMQRIPLGNPWDAAEALFAWLWREAGFWMGIANLEARPIAHMVRRDDNLKVIGSRWISSDEAGADGLTRDARELVGIILRAWPDIETRYSDPANWGATVGEQWASEVDKYLLTPHRQFPLTERAVVPERPKRCPVCGERACFTAGIDMDAFTAACAKCKTVIGGEAWMPVKDAADILQIDKSTIHKWIRDGFPSRVTSKGREIDVRAAKLEQETRDARKRLNLAERHSA